MFDTIMLFLTGFIICIGGMFLAIAIAIVIGFVIVCLLKILFDLAFK